MSSRLKLSSVSAKILAAFFAILAIFGGVTAYGAYTTRHLGDRLLRLASGYLALRVDVQELQKHQDSLLRKLEERAKDGNPPDDVVKVAVDNARSFRRSAVRRVKERVGELRASESIPDEAAFLSEIAERLQTIETWITEDEQLFDHVYGPPRAQRIVATEPAHDEIARDRLVRREEKLFHNLDELSKALQGRVQSAEARLAVDERRAVWATVLLAVIAALLGLGAMALAQRALAPLRRLAAGAKQLARGDYKQRVEVGSSDEIGALAGEFNAMAAALEEREQRLIRSERLAAVGKIAAQITHEIRNPLSSIGLNAELILDDLDDASEGRVLVQAIIKEVDRLTAITEQYLRFTRLPRPKLEREDANAIVSSLLAFLKEELDARKVQVEARLAPSLPPVAADENQLRQALLNLLRNAAEAMPDGGRLTVTTAATADPDRPVEVIVSDTGSGIAPEIRAKIFDPFFSTKAGGTGLGLALTQQIVVDHGGAIDVDSSPGQGTRFTVRLPALADDAPLVTAVAQASRTP